MVLTSRPDEYIAIYAKTGDSTAEVDITRCSSTEPHSFVSCSQIDQSEEVENILFRRRGIPILICRGARCATEALRKIGYSPTTVCDITIDMELAWMIYRGEEELADAGDLVEEMTYQFRASALRRQGRTSFFCQR
jgi:hypothetical protein